MLTGSLLLYDRHRPTAGARAQAGWLLLLSTFAILTHPFLDWLNTYGMRWLMPFDGTWFYGDSVFIMDPFLLSILCIGMSSQRWVRFTATETLTGATGYW